MRAWAFLLGGLLVWASHFFLVYIAASLFPGTLIARWLTAALTIAALAAVAVIGLAALRRLRTAANDQVDCWSDRLSLLGCGLGAVAIIFQGTPALLS